MVIHGAADALATIIIAGLALLVVGPIVGTLVGVLIGLCPAIWWGITGLFAKPTPQPRPPGGWDWEKPKPRLRWNWRRGVFEEER